VIIYLLVAWLLGGLLVGFSVWLVMRRLLDKWMYWGVYLAKLLEDRYGAVAYMYQKSGRIEIEFAEGKNGPQVS